MDETTTSMQAAAATRKRRSSILKSQRPPRTPFSELEFNVATPTDTAKSRRVSFSKRTGVAEFVTNEATTTWKNFYEEHNKSLESSGNESAANAPRQVIGHIGKSLFDQQFEEIEVVDIGGTLQTNSAHEFQTPHNNLNLTQQFAAFECIDNTTDIKISAPQQNFELSALTDNHSKVFGNDLSIPTVPEMSNPININFSNIQSIGSNSKCDDLEEIQRDLERSHIEAYQQNVICQGPFGGDKELSEYIEIDLNMTCLGSRNDDCDMSISDITISSPKVQETLTNNISHHKKSNDDEWAVNKENIVSNPYVAPQESLNFAINEVSDEVLVFDGKKLVVQSERVSVLDLKENKIPTVCIDADIIQTKKSHVNVKSNEIQQHSTLINKKHVENGDLKKSVIYNDIDLSITQTVDNKIPIQRRKTIIFDDELNNITITQAISTNAIIDQAEIKKTILYENDMDLSLTQAIPAKIIGAEKSIVDKRNTFADDDDNISFTQAIPANIILNASKKSLPDKTVYFQDELDISLTQVIPENIIKSSLTTFDKKDLNNLSMTQVIPTNIIQNEIKLSTGNDEVNGGNSTQQDTDIDTTRAVSDNAIFTNKNSSEKRRTIVFEQDAGNISVTQVVPSNIFVEKITVDNADINVSKIGVKTESLKLCNKKESIKSNTIIYDDLTDISVTTVMPSNILLSNRQEGMTDGTPCDNDCSITRALPSNIILQEAVDEIKTQSSDKDDNADVTKLANDKTTNNRDISSNAVGNNISKILLEPKLQLCNKENNDLSNLSLTKPIPNEILDIQNELSNKYNSKNILKDNASISQDFLIYQTTDHKISEVNEATKQVYSKIGDRSSINTSIKKSNESIDYCNSSIRDVMKVVSPDKCNEKDKNKPTKQKDNVDEEIGKDLMSLPNNSKIKQTSKSQKSILNELLDMSCTSLIDEQQNPAFEHIESDDSDENVTDKSKQIIENKSNNSYFVITRDSENDMKIENTVKQPDCTNDEILKDTSFCNAIESNEELHQGSDLQQKVAELKVLEKRKSLNRYYEKILSSDMQRSVHDSDNSVVKHDLSMPKSKKSLRNADDTKELLEMLSDFTDCPVQKHDSSNRSVVIADTKDPVIQNETFPKLLSAKKHTALEDNNVPPRVSIIPNRQSIALSREDLLNNISMAQAALRQSRLEIDESGNIEETEDSPENVEESFENRKSPRKSVRMSTDVVKTLQFDDDESFSEVNINTDMKRSPLKKTAFGETSYMKEDKSKVIPSYLKDVSDGIKALMHDLVKPAADDRIPFNAELEKSAKKAPSTCSTQIQANLITSSQIDIDVELRSTADSDETIKPKHVCKEVDSSFAHGPVTNALRQSLKPIPNSMSMEGKSILEVTINNQTIHQSPGPDPVILFDHHNPLNNILLTQTDYTKVHKYEPLSSSSKTSSDNDNSSVEITDTEKQMEVDRISVHYNVENQLSPFQSTLPSGDTCTEKVSKCNSVVSNVSKPLSIDRSTDGLVMEVKDTEVNTLIAMKGNKDLLKSNSSLTLVDDAGDDGQSQADSDVERKSSSDGWRQQSPIKVIYKMDTDENLINNIDFTLNNNEFMENKDNSAISRKRSYSPTKQDRPIVTQTVEVTPKPVSKMQKISKTPETTKVTNYENACKIERKLSPKTKIKVSPEKKKSPKKRNSPKREEITVQQLITECYKDSIDTKINKQILEALNSCPSENLNDENLSQTMVCVKSVDIVPSLDKKEPKEMLDESSLASKDITAVGSKVSHLDWQTDVVDALSSKNLIEECSSSANVVAKIDTLPFMGRECEWESSGGDVWMFRLLRSRLRITVRLAHTHHNASRSRVRADTALVSIVVDTVRKEEKDPLAALCVRLAMEAMRYECSRCGLAGDVPALLRRCAAVARVALRWARVMRDARARLAYTVTPDGDLTLKVANIPLRSVWEVRMRVELVVEDAREGAWPRVERVSARSVLAAGAAPAAPRLERLARSPPQDWGHAPAVLWKVFKYLKNKTRDDDLLEL